MRSSPHRIVFLACAPLWTVWREALGENWEFLGFLDDAEELQGQERYGLPVLGPLAAMESVGATHYAILLGPRYLFLRPEWHRRARAAGLQTAAAVDPGGRVARTARLEAGVLVAAGCAVGGGSHLEEGAHLGVGAVVSHDVWIGPHAYLGPGCVISGTVRVEREVFVGAGAVVFPGVTLGEGCQVSAGAVVVESVPPGRVAAGCPAIPLWPVRTGRRMGFRQEGT